MKNREYIEDNFVVENTITQLEVLEEMIDNDHHLQWALWKHEQLYALLSFEIEALSTQGLI